MNQIAPLIADLFSLNRTLISNVLSYVSAFNCETKGIAVMAIIAMPKTPFLRPGTYSHIV